MILTAEYANYGPMRGLVRYLRPEVKGDQRWTVRLKISHPMPDGWKQDDEISVTAPAPMSLGQMRETVFGQIRESIGDSENCRVSMTFHVPRKRR